MTKINEKFCGNCCWFYAEDTYGFGICPFRFGEVAHCEGKCKNGEYVSRKEMRHHMAVLLQWKRWLDLPITESSRYYRHDLDDVSKAIEFSVKYMKVFSEL